MRDPLPKTSVKVPVVMTIAGSDSGGGAGIQADLRTFASLGVFGTSAVTCVTAQNPDNVAGVAALDPGMVARQVSTVADGFPVAAAKTGMLFSSVIIRAVADVVAACSLEPLVVDPVMVATSGARLLQEEAVQALCADLIPLATLLTPNLPEAEILCGHAIGSPTEIESACREIGQKFGTSCVVKGGHMSGSEITDVLYHDGHVRSFVLDRVEVEESHGTGCTFSAAVTAWLARGAELPEAVQRAQAFVAGAIRYAMYAGRHRPLGIEHALQRDDASP